jgi:hypothetical protein
VIIPVRPAHLLSPLPEQLGIFTEAARGNGGIKIIHALTKLRAGCDRNDQRRVIIS